MKKSEVKVGSHYTARVSGVLTVVRVDAIREVVKRRRYNYMSGNTDLREGVVYDVTNIRTGRKTTFRSAAKFRAPALPETIAHLQKS